jgi:hypothetical protein
MSGFRDFNLSQLTPKTKTLSSSLEEEDWETHDEPVTDVKALPVPKPIAPKAAQSLPLSAHSDKQQPDWLKARSSNPNLNTLQPSLAKSSSQGIVSEKLTKSQSLTPLPGVGSREDLSITNSYSNMGINANLLAQKFPFFTREEINAFHQQFMSLDKGNGRVDAFSNCIPFYYCINITLLYCYSSDIL